MHREYHRWWSGRTGRDMELIVYGHYGAPVVAFPTGGGEAWEYENRGIWEARRDLFESGRLKVFSVGSLGWESLENPHVHPLHRSYMQARFDDYIANEVLPFVRHHCRDGNITVGTFGASLGAYQAVNCVLKHPDAFKRAVALSGIYDLHVFMGDAWDDNVYYNSPVDYLPGLNDPWWLGQLSTCYIQLVTGCGPWEDAGPSYRLMHMLGQKGIPNRLDDWGPRGGHDWPFWVEQAREYLGYLAG